jgi:ribosomal protein S18 acetylase RimI-like enzyme
VSSKVVRPASIDDAQAIARVHVASWRSTYRTVLPDDFLASLTESAYADRWQRFIQDRPNLIYVVEDEGHDGSGVVGFASGGRERAGEEGYSGELYAIYILDAFQGRGHGRELVRAVVTGLQEMGLDDMIIWVLRDNRPARDFYERLGGVYVRTQPITIGSVTLEEVSYGWPRLDGVRY